MITVYCDGSSSGKSNAPGGYGWIIVRDGTVLLSGYGGDPKTTNNLQELRAAYEGLETVIRLNLRQEKEAVVLVSDSMYTLRFADGTFQAKVNREETMRLRKATLTLEATTRWVKGHGIKQGTPWEDHDIDTLMNHRCDSLAKLGKKKITEEIAKTITPDIKPTDS